MSSSNGGQATITIGAIFAGLLSYFKWHSVGWAIIHSVFCGWFYVIYFWIRYGLHF